MSFERTYDRATVRRAARVVHDAAVEGDTWIYAIQVGGYGGDIKIGISRDPVARLKALQTGHPEPLRGIGAWPGTVEDERALHEQYAGTRIRGEWFAHSLPLWNLIRDFGDWFDWKQ